MTVVVIPENMTAEELEAKAEDLRKHAAELREFNALTDEEKAAIRDKAGQ